MPSFRGAKREENPCPLLCLTAFWLHLQPQLRGSVTKEESPGLSSECVLRCMYREIITASRKTRTQYLSLAHALKCLPVERNYKYHCLLNDMKEFQRKHTPLSCERRSAGEEEREKEEIVFQTDNPSAQLHRHRHDAMETSLAHSRSLHKEELHHPSPGQEGGHPKNASEGLPGSRKERNLSRPCSSSSSPQPERSLGGEASKAALLMMRKKALARESTDRGGLASSISCQIADQLKHKCLATPDPGIEDILLNFREMRPDATAEDYIR